MRGAYVLTYKFFRVAKDMPKRALITIRLLPEAEKVSNEKLRLEIEKEISKAIFVIPG